MNADFSKALAVAERLLTDSVGQAHLPPALRAELRSLTPRPTNATPATDPELQAIRRLRGQGHTYRQIERRLKISYGRVAKVCQEFGTKH